MKCSVCGHRANSLAAMAKHFRKKHPNRMKRKPTQRAQMPSMRELKKMTKMQKEGFIAPSFSAQLGAVRQFCPYCGGRLI